MNNQIDLTLTQADLDAILEAALDKARMTREEWLDEGYNGCSRGCGCALYDVSEDLAWAFKNRTLFGESR